jgi:beta-glucanase (GH16 family)
MKYFALAVWAIVASSIVNPGAAKAQNWTLVWSDEFNAPAGTLPDASKWGYDTGGGGFGNNELEIYCAAGSNTAPCSSANPNTYQDGNGNLVIKAINTNGTWTSGRMKTQGLEQFQYGRIEARIKLQVGKGLWPAFWMLGTDIGTAGWPTCGEQDIMEWILQYTANTTSSTIHGPGYSGANGIGSKFTFPNGGRVDDANYHIYGIVWSPNQIQFYRDDSTKPFFTVTPSSIPAGTQWVYNNPFFLLLNLAVGGNFPGNPDGTTPNPAVMLVDYVRVYTPSTSNNNGIAVDAGGGATGNFVADADFTGGTAANTTAAIDTSLVPAPVPPQAVYQTERYGPSTYTIPGLTAGGRYNVALHFAEFFWSNAGQRQFNVSINGTQVLSNFDIIAATGAKDKAIVENFPATANANGQIAIQFSNGAADMAKISGIVVAPGGAISINTGGTGAGNFVADSDFIGGTAANTTSAIDTSLLTFPAPPQAVLQDERYGPSTYTIPGFAAGSSHSVTLYFAENYWNAVGQRRFNVSINGITVLTNFDIFAATGAKNKAIQQQFTETADAHGQYVIRFTNGTADLPKIGGININ